MGRTFDFGETAKRAARLRQNGHCAHCGDDLTDESEHAHHVVPNQSGRADNPQHAWLRGAENCVILCEPCHWRVHENGRYKNGAVAPPDYYEHSHGTDAAAHRDWVTHLNLLARHIWG